MYINYDILTIYYDGFLYRVEFNFKVSLLKEIAPMSFMHYKACVWIQIGLLFILLWLGWFSKGTLFIG